MSAVTTFLVSDTFVFKSMLEICAHIYFWNNFFSNFSKGPPYDLGIFHFSRKIKNLKMPQIIGGPFKRLKKILFQKSKCTYVSSINLKGKVSDTKNSFTFITIHMEHPVQILHEHNSQPD